VTVGDISNLNLLNVLKYKYLVITKPEESINLILKRLNKSKTQNIKSKITETKTVV
jgi:uncharacterized coiled-coil protein SlyX